MTHNRRGHYGIAMLTPSHKENISGVARATGCFDADYMAVVGRDYDDHAAGVGHDRHTPIWQFKHTVDFLGSLPYDTQVVAIDVDEDATPLSEYHHPERAIYVLGEEGPGFENHQDVLDRADDTVYIESEYCMNVAVAGNMILRDRYNADS